MRKRYTSTDIMCAAALITLPWQARWIFSYHLLNGQRYEYGAFGLYASMVLLAGALYGLLFLDKQRFSVPRSMGYLLAWLGGVVLLQQHRDIGMYYLFVAIMAFGYCLIASLWDRSRVTGALIASGVVQACCAWYYFIAQYITPSTVLGVAEHDPMTAGQSVVIIHGLRLLRAYGLFPHPNIFGAFCAVVLVVAVLWVVRTSRDREQSVSLWQWFAVLIMFSGVLTSFSRAALLGIVLWFVAVTGYTFFVQHWREGKVLLRIGAGCALLLLVFSALTGNIWLTRFGVGLDGAGEQGRLERISQEQRIASYHEARVLFTVRSAVVGLGLGEYVPTLAAVFPSFPVYVYQPTHNALALALLEIGIVGVALYAIVITQLIQKSWTKRFHTYEYQLVFSVVCLIAFLVLFDHFWWTQYSGQALAWLSIGLLAQRE